MNPEKDLTVVIPVYNRSELIVRSLDSVYAQTRRPARVIVVDNGSADETRSVALKWAETHRSETFRVDVYDEPERGAWAARNRGLAEVDTEWVSFFDSDDAMRPTLMEEASENADGADMVVWKIQINYGEKGIIKRSARGDIVRRHVFNAVLGTVRYMARTDLVRDAGGWRRAYVWDDWELGMRLLGKNPAIRIVDSVLVDVYFQNESITGTSFHSKEGEWEKVIDMIEASVDERENDGWRFDWKGHDRKHIRGMMDYIRVILAAHYAKEGYLESGRKLMCQTLAGSRLTWFRKQLLKFIYHYTRKGGRAAYLLWR